MIPSSNDDEDFTFAYHGCKGSVKVCQKQATAKWENVKRADFRGYLSLDESLRLDGCNCWGS